MARYLAMTPLPPREGQGEGRCTGRPTPTLPFPWEGEGWRAAGRVPDRELPIRREIAPHLRYFVAFAHAFPARAFAIGAGLSKLYMRKFGRFTREQEAFFAEMLADTQPAFVRWGIAAITAWPGPGELSMPVYHIHGDADELIPIGGVQPDEVVPGGGHLLNVTHAAEVSAFLAQHLG